MKKSKQCPKCDSLRIGCMNIHPGGDRVGMMKDVEVVLETEGKKQLWFADKQEIGDLEAFVCTKCGYYESYVRSPERFNWEALEGFHWVNPPPQDGPGPYR